MLYSSPRDPETIKPGAPVTIIYNRFFPQYFMFPYHMDDYRADFFMTLACALFIGLCVVVYVRQQIKYRQFRERMKYY